MNGVRAKKKSQVLDEGDEVDIVRGPNQSNPLFIDVNRVEIVEVGETKDKNEDDFESDSDDEGQTKIPMTLKRYKNLTIENYPVPVSQLIMVVHDPHMYLYVHLDILIMPSLYCSGKEMCKKIRAYIFSERGSSDCTEIFI